MNTNFLYFSPLHFCSHPSTVYVHVQEEKPTDKDDECSGSTDLEGVSPCRWKAELMEIEGRLESLNAMLSNTTKNETQTHTNLLAMMEIESLKWELVATELLIVTGKPPQSALKPVDLSAKSLLRGPYGAGYGGYRFGDGYHYGTRTGHYYGRRGPRRFSRYRRSRRRPRSRRYRRY